MIALDSLSTQLVYYLGSTENSSAVQAQKSTENQNRYLNAQTEDLFLISILIISTVPVIRNFATSTSLRCFAFNDFSKIFIRPARSPPTLSARENGLLAGPADGPCASTHTGPAPSIDVSIDFSRSDGSRTRPLLVEGKRLYVDEHYISVWSPVLRAWCIECPDRELILANVQYEHVLEMLEVIHPTYKAIDDQSVHVLLPLAYDYQMEGLLHRCECFLINHTMPFLEKVWVADRYKLNRLLVLCLREMKPHSKIDMSGSRYHALSDRVKVLLLERLHGAPAPQEIPEPPLDLDPFQRASDMNFAAIRAKTGRLYYVNPYYIAAWSNMFQERVFNRSTQMEELYCNCTHEELKAFLMAIHPPQLRINEQNIGPVLMSGCRMESPALLRKCATILLNPLTQLSVFVRLSLLDRCFLHEMLPSCLAMVQRPEHLIQMTQQSTYECLSTRARACMMNRLAVLLDKPGLQSHNCTRCKQHSNCSAVTWMCPHCKTYSTDANLLRTGQGSSTGTSTALGQLPR